MDSISVSSNATAEQTVVIQSTSPNGSGGTDDSIALKEHPLLNPLIVDKIVEQLNPSFEQLKTLRLVSKTWADATLQHWRNKSAVLTLIPDPTPTLFTVSEPCGKGLPVVKFFKEFQDPQSPYQLSTKPFLKYKFKGLTFDIHVCNKIGGPAQTFWNTIGPLIESLYLENCVFLEPYSVKVTSPVVQLLVAMIPNVKHLVLKDLLIQRTHDKWQVFTERPHLSLRTLTVYGLAGWNNMMLRDLFKSAPHLESVKGMGAIWPSIMDEIYQARFKPNPEEEEGVVSPLPLSNLKHLDLINSSEFAPNHYSQAVNIAWKHLPLETLTLHLEVSAVCRLFETDVNKFLTSFSGSLKTLELYRPPVEPTYLTFLSGTSGACEMTLLAELYLWGAIASDFTFLKSTPNLKRLTINLGCFEKREQTKNWMKERRESHRVYVRYQKYNEDMVAKIPTNLKEGGILCTQLEYFEIDYEFPEESLRVLGKWMPNLIRLKTILNGSTIPVVCEIWRDLTELVCLHGSRVNNSCVIKEGEKASFSGDLLPKLKICDLKDLERFQVDTYCGESELTEVVVFEGFLKMPGLKSVHICVNDSEMSEEAEEALKKGVQFCTVIRNDDDGNANCGCDRCAFQKDAEKGFLESDDEEYDEDGSSMITFYDDSDEFDDMWVGLEEGDIEEDDNMVDSDDSGGENEEP